MHSHIFLQASDLPGTLLELKNAFLYWFEYLPKLVNVILVIWIIAVFFTWRLVSKQSLVGFFWGLLQSFLVFSVENGQIPCSDASFYLWIFTIVNLLALFSPIIIGFGPSIASTFIDSYNAIRDAFIFLFFSCLTFIIMNKPYSISNFDIQDYLTLNQFGKSIFPIYVCNKILGLE